MTVPSWEFRALAVMLIGTHGDDAEAEAAQRLRAAEEAGDSGQKVVWYEVTRRLPDIKAEHAKREG